MKIAQIVCVFPPYKGGIGKSAKDISSMMTRLGHQVDVFTPDYFRGENNINNSEDNFQIKKIKPILKLGNGAFIPGLFFKLSGYDLIYLHYPFFGGAELVWLYKIFNKKAKIIVHYHMDVDGLSPLKRLLTIPSQLIFKSLLKKSDLIVASTFDYLDNSKHSKIFNRHRSKWRESLFPVDTSFFRPLDEKKERNIKNLLFVGGLDKAHYFKGVELLLESLAKIKHRQDWRLKIVGQGDLLPYYKKLTKTNGLSQKVDFLTSVEDDELSSVYQASDIFILPSINSNEAFGIVLLEAMACGLALIASRLVGVRKVFNNGEQGYYFNPEDGDDLLDKIIMLLDDNQKIITMSEKSRALAEKKYEKKQIKNRFDLLIKELNEGSNN